MKEGPGLEPQPPDGAEVPGLEWPPTEADLRRLYVEEKRSAIEIAKIYGLRTKNPRSAPYLITYHLKKHGIERRNRVAELAKQTSAVVIEWSSKHPPSGPGQSDRLPEVEAVIELLRLPNLSIKHLDQTTRRRVRDVIHYLHHEQGLSLTDIAIVLGNKTSGYTSWVARQVGIKPRDFEEARLKGIHEKVRKYERRPFDGSDEEKAYLLGLKHGDLYAYSPFGDAVRVQTSTTHRALANLFTELFGRYGHVDMYPRNKEDIKSYEWNLQVILDRSFGFLLESRDQCRQWVARKEGTMLAYLAGLVDAEGHIRIFANPRTVGISVTIYNTDLQLLEFAFDCFARLGSRPSKPYLEKRGGYISSKGFKIPMRKDYWRVMVAKFNEAQSLLQRMPLRHQEKVAWKTVGLSVVRGDSFKKVAEKLASLKKYFREETTRFTKEADDEYRRTHSASPPVVCILRSQAWKHESETYRDAMLAELSTCNAAHDSILCKDGKPCTVICKDCNEENIFRLLVHESVHHALLWMDDEHAGIDGGPDDIVLFMQDGAIILEDEDYSSTAA